MDDFCTVAPSQEMYVVLVWNFRSMPANSVSKGIFNCSVSFAFSLEKNDSEPLMNFSVLPGFSIVSIIVN